MNGDLLLRTIRAKVSVPDEEFEEYFSLCEVRTYKKGEHIYKEGDIPRFNIFVAKGCIRTYYLGEEGKERTTQFAEEGYWTGDLESMRSSKATQQNLQALEDCEIFTLSREKWEYANNKFTWISAFHAAGQQRRAAKLAEQIGRLLTDTPETNYIRLMDERPTLVQRVPLYYIASYLGITAETLSRIRKKIAS